MTFDVFESLGSQYGQGRNSFKFPPMEGVTKVLDIKLQVNEPSLTPVAFLSPIVIGGAKEPIKLGNKEEIKRLDLKIGILVVTRSGDVIQY